ncbi:hypothetical protein F4X10_02975 [Candidatus Poribacteria bacterium]|nr:hypothetical protein [Candidatus Poribacteria bacterium]
MKKGDTTTMNRLESRLLRGVMLLAILGILGTVLPVLGNWSVLQERDPEVRDYMSIAFTSKNNGWVVGAASFEDFENPGFIGYTMDGGKSWQKSEIKIPADLAEVYFLDDKYGWAVGADGTIVGTDNGRDWELQTSKVGNGLKGIYFVNKEVGYAVGESDTILSTKNGGRSWKVLQGGQLGAVGDDDANMYSAIQFLDEETGWIAGVRVSPSTQGQHTLIQKTMDGGQTWNTQAINREDILEDIFFLDASMGWAVGENGVILHTSNGGETWQDQTSGTEETLRSVGFADEKNGWAVGGDFGVGAILRTSDGGETWELEDSREKLVKVFVLDGQNVWVAGSTGAIMQAE